MVVAAGAVVEATRIRAAVMRTRADLIQAVATPTLVVAAVPMLAAATAEAAAITAAEATTEVAATADITGPDSASDSMVRLITAMDTDVLPLAARPAITISTEIGFRLGAPRTRIKRGWVLWCLPSVERP